MRLSQDEIDLILQNSEKSIQEISRLVGRQKQTVVSVLRRNGHKPRNQRVPFSADENRFIIENYERLGAGEIAARLGRSMPGVHRQARKLDCGVNKKWTANDDSYIKNNYRILTAAEIGVHLGCSVSSVRARANKIGLTKKRIAQ